MRIVRKVGVALFTIAGGAALVYFAPTPATPMDTVHEQAPTNITHVTNCLAPPQGANTSGIAWRLGGDSPEAVSGQISGRRFSAKTGMYAGASQISLPSGIAVAPCLLPQNELWLATTATSVGNSATLHIAKPEAPVEVSLEMWGATGKVDAPQTIYVSDERQIDLASLAPDEDALAIHLSAPGRGISAWVETRKQKGTVDKGVEVASPSLLQKVHSIALPTVAGTLYVVNPHGTAVKVHTFSYQKGVFKPVSSGDFTVDGDSVFALPLGGISEDATGLKVQADATVVAAVSFERGSDFALASAPPASQVGILAVPETARVIAVANGPIEFSGPNYKTFRPGEKLVLERGVWQWKGAANSFVSAVVEGENKIAYMPSVLPAQKQESLKLRVNN
ncbi:MAG: DUF5719 family protein [Actinomycetaceae bacterium]|nr:DUF5719 family protein [Actinomycetaceae bacterium]